MNGDISPDFPYEMKRVAAQDAEMAYVDVGAGDPIVFLHGNPSSSYLWRNVIPYALPFGRCLAPDLIGFGQSSASPSKAYRYPDHIAYLDAWFDKVGLDRNIVLVIQDWGAALGFHRAARFPATIQGICYMEAMVRPRLWTDIPPERQAIFKRLRGTEGEQLVLKENFFVDKMLFEYGTIRRLSTQEKAIYGKRFQNEEARFPTLQFPRDIPFDGEPADICAIVKNYSDFMSTSDQLPKLFIDADEGHGTAGDARVMCRAWPNQINVTVHARHYVPEDAPHEIGHALTEFLGRLRR